MEANDMARIYAQVVNGKPKAQSGLLVDDEASAFWDTVEAEVNAMREANPNVVFDVPSEVPEADDLTGMNPGGEFGQPDAPEAGAAPAEDAPKADADAEEGADAAEKDPDDDAAADDADDAADAPEKDDADDETSGKPKKGVNPFADKEED